MTIAADDIMRMLGAVEFSRADLALISEAVEDKTRKVERISELLSRAQGLSAAEIRELPDEMQGHNRYHLAILSGDYYAIVEQHRALRDKVRSLLDGKATREGEVS